VRGSSRDPDGPGGTRAERSATCGLVLGCRRCLTLYPVVDPSGDVISRRTRRTLLLRRDLRPERRRQAPPPRRMLHERGRICLPSEELRGREEVRILRARIMVGLHGAKDVERLRWNACVPTCDGCFELHRIVANREEWSIVLSWVALAKLGRHVVERCPQCSEELDHLHQEFICEASLRQAPGVVRDYDERCFVRARTIQFFARSYALPIDMPSRDHGFIAEH
jgi:hypothetical protein